VNAATIFGAAPPDAHPASAPAPRASRKAAFIASSPFAVLALLVDRVTA
jgi:hypothetical protein